MNSLEDLRAWANRCEGTAQGFEDELARQVRRLFEEWDAACEEFEAVQPVVTWRLRA